MYTVEWDDFIRNKDDGAGRAASRMAATIGVFDGVHRGHIALINRARSMGVPVVVTFKQNPGRILSPLSFRGDVYSLRQKLSVFEECGVTLTVLIDFSGNFSRITGKVFVDLLKSRRDLAFLAVGADFHCGRHLDTDAAALKNMAGRAGIRTEIIPPVMEGRRPVSSSRIRAAVASGDLEDAALLLGRPFGIDLSDLPSSVRNGERIFDAGAAMRITPPSGLYAALVFGTQSEEGAKTEVSVAGGKIGIPRGFSGEGAGHALQRLLFV
ncbi:MAG: FAD synthetase family protein [Treponema sp.]|jgi:riboflavin kinase/FMN adenylyltransferase|nr:FAD synthetase family protein [Treponema sp.]